VLVAYQLRSFAAAQACLETVTNQHLVRGTGGDIAVVGYTSTGSCR
jgi:hypothetical protein